MLTLNRILLLTYSRLAVAMTNLHKGCTSDQNCCDSIFAGVSVQYFIKILIEVLKAKWNLIQFKNWTPCQFWITNLSFWISDVCTLFRINLCQGNLSLIPQKHLVSTKWTFCTLWQMYSHHWEWWVHEYWPGYWHPDLLLNTGRKQKERKDGRRHKIEFGTMREWTELMNCSRGFSCLLTGSTVFLCHWKVWSSPDQSHVQCVNY